MKRAGLVVAALAACTKPSSNGGGLEVTVTLAPGLTSQCVQVAVKAPGVELRTMPIPLSGQAQIIAAIGQGQLPAGVTLYALGFSDAACMTETVPSERSKDLAEVFVAGEVHPVMLALAPGSANHDAQCGGGHADCTLTDCDGLPCLNGGTCASGACGHAQTENGLCDDGIDNDSDGFTDCEDSDCLAAACKTTDRCTTGATCDASKACTGGTPKVCAASGSACHVGAGTCDSTTGACVYASADAGTLCDDGNVCTHDDACDATGTCSGAMVSCNNPPSQCFTTTGATCDPLAGCQYALATATACDDAQSCTVGDACLGDGGCAGAAIVCAPGACQTFAGQCSADGGCQFAARDAGAACDAGLCNAGGGCIPLFSVPPSNFTEDQVPTPPGDVTLNCGITTISTSGTPSFNGWCAGQPLPGVAIIAQSGGDEAVLVSFTNLTVAAGASLHVTGTRPLIIAATGDVTVAGSINVGAGATDCRDGGAGAVGGNGDTQGGAGGGSLASAGGSGGKGSPAVTTGQGGAPGLVDANALLVPLRGGCPGGIGHGSGATPATGGGALQISVAGTLVVSGSLEAPGSGGAKANAIGNGGNGGGSGGVILLEATVMTLTGVAAIAASGGGGGEGAGLAIDGAPGSAGLSDGGAAPGGASASAGGNGGSGATQGAAARSGGDATIGGGGGGGGGLGRIRVRAGISCSVGAQVIFTPAANTDAGC